MRIHGRDIKNFGSSAQEIAGNLITHILTSHLKGDVGTKELSSPLFYDAPHADANVESVLKEYKSEHGAVLSKEKGSAITKPLSEASDKLQSFLYTLEEYEKFPLNPDGFGAENLPLLPEDKAILIEKAQGMKRYMGLFSDDNGDGTELSFSVPGVNSGSAFSINYEDVMAYSDRLGGFPTVFLTSNKESAMETEEGMSQTKRITLYPRNPYFLREGEELLELKDHPQMLNDIRQHKYDSVLSLDLGECIVLHPSVFSQDLGPQLTPDFHSITRLNLDQPDAWDHLVSGFRQVVSTLGLIIEKHGIQHAVHTAEQLHSTISEIDNNDLKILSNAHKLVMRDLSTDLRLGAPGFRAIGDTLIGDILKSSAKLVSYEQHAGLPEGQGVLRFYSHHEKLDELFESFSFDTRTQKRMDGLMSPDISDKLVTKLPSNIMDPQVYEETKSLLDGFRPGVDRKERIGAIHSKIQNLLVGQSQPEERVFCKMMSIAAKHYFEESFSKDPYFVLSTLIDLVDTMPMLLGDEMKQELWNQSSHQLSSEWIEATWSSVLTATDSMDNQAKALSTYIDSLKNQGSVDFQFSAISYLISEAEFDGLQVIASTADKLATDFLMQRTHNAMEQSYQAGENLRMALEHDPRVLPNMRHRP